MKRLDKLLQKARDKESVIGWPYITDVSFIEALGVNPEHCKKALPNGDVVYDIQQAGTIVASSLIWAVENEE